MYLPKYFSAPNTEAVYDVICAYPLATLVAMSSTGLNANHLPLQLTQQDGSLGKLSGHLARENPLCKEITKHSEVLAIFHGPNAYITPSWYPTKAETGRVVPTWNYVAVHVHGRLKVIEDTQWLCAHLASLTTAHEAGFEKPWQLGDAPPDFIEKLVQAVVGIEIDIISLTGKWKASQNQPVENQRGVMQGLHARNHAEAHEMASIIKQANNL